MKSLGTKSFGLISNETHERNFMILSGRTILITGGSAGIGLAFALKFVELGNEVIVTGRRESVLEEVKRRHHAISSGVRATTFSGRNSAGQLVPSCLVSSRRAAVLRSWPDPSSGVPSVSFWTTPWTVAMKRFPWSFR